MAENKFKYFTVTTTSIVKAANKTEAEKIASGSRRKVAGVAGELIFKDVTGLDVVVVTVIVGTPEEVNILPIVLLFTLKVT
jgi:hypothetical protein